MGYYIEVEKNLDKASQIMGKYGATQIDKPTKFSDIPNDRALICVVNNGMFEAAGYCYDSQEYSEFSDPSDNRPKQWLLMDLELAKKLTNFRRF